MSNDQYFWKYQDEAFPPNYYEGDLQNLQLDFNQVENFDNFDNQSPSSEMGKMYEPASFTQPTEFDEEPPLLEELEIYPDRILQKVLAVLNPFKGHGLTDDAEYLTKDADLAGPIFFYLILAVSLFLSGNKAHFGYIYGISVISCIFMYALLTLMTPQSVFTVTTVASVLGYSLIPIIGLSVLGIFLFMSGWFALILSTLAVFWSSTSASRLFVAISGDREQQLLLGYPCALVSAVYVLLIIF